MIDPNRTVSQGLNRIDEYFAYFDKYRLDLELWERVTGFYRKDFSFCPWEALGIFLDTYNSEIDDQAIKVLEAIKKRKFSTDIAEETGLHPAHVELYQTMFCAVNLCDYGCSPRGCWPTNEEQFDRFLTLWKMNLSNLDTEGEE